MKLRALIFLFLATTLALTACDNKSANQEILLPGIVDFLEKNKDYGSVTVVYNVPDWAEGKRQRVKFDKGRNLLFYLKNGEVISIYEDKAGSGRALVWGEYSNN